jgi:hypothetical protein
LTAVLLLRGSGDIRNADYWLNIVGASRELAERVRRQLEAKLALGDPALFDSGERTQMLRN